MKGLVKAGFKLGFGLYFGYNMGKTLDHAGMMVFKKYVPEKYWNIKHPENMYHDQYVDKKNRMMKQP